MTIAFVAAAKRPDNQTPPYNTATIDTTGANLLFAAGSQVTFDTTDSKSNAWTALTVAQENSYPVYLRAGYV